MKQTFTKVQLIMYQFYGSNDCTKTGCTRHGCTRSGPDVPGSQKNASTLARASSSSIAHYSYSPTLALKHAGATRLKTFTSQQPGKPPVHQLPSPWRRLSSRPMLRRV